VLRVLGEALTAHRKERHAATASIDGHAPTGGIHVEQRGRRLGPRGRLEVPDLAQALDGAVEDMTTITGQRPVITKARKSIANFKLREGRAIGVKTTLRGERMWSFLDRLMNVALPRVRDFRGVSPNSFDGRGNYTLGFREQLIFPEIDYDKIDKVRGFEITIVTTALNDEEARRLLGIMGMPFRKEG